VTGQENGTFGVSSYMANTVLVGAQWGDEGKGKVIDYLTEQVDVVVRSQGGNNAGHTVVVGETTYKLRLVPSGILRPDKVCIIGNGVVIDPISLCEEIAELEGQGVQVTERNLLISESAHLVFPYHRLIDEQREAAQSKNKIGTTKRGIGPAYGDKVARVGIRLCDLMQPELFEERLFARVQEANWLLEHFGGQPVDPKKLLSEYLVAGKRLRPMLKNTVLEIHRLMSGGKQILFEGAQGTFLDIDHGTYPYVTSSNTTAGGACTGAGVPPNRIDRVVGAMKAYTTRVGEGPFPTENEGISELLHGMGREYGAVTGRARRCGWFDAVATRFATIVNGIDELAVTNLDGLDGLETLKICTSYELDGRQIQFPPACVRQFSRCVPIYIEMPGWKQPTTRARTFSDLPINAQGYLRKICELSGAKLMLVGIGQKREETILV
jgi:adenylosuccinate synthase